MEQPAADLNDQLKSVIADIGARKLLVQEHYRMRNLDAMREEILAIGRLEIQRTKLRALIDTIRVAD